MRILLAEDDPAFGPIIARGLREQGYDVDLVADGDAAFANARASRFDLIILDVRMPRRDGIETCRMLRAHGVDASVLLMTADDAVDREVAFSAGADGYIAKPFSFRELTRNVGTLVQHRHGTIDDRSMTEVASRAARLRRIIQRKSPPRFVGTHGQALFAHAMLGYRWVRARWIRRIAWLWVAFVAASLVTLTVFAKVGEDVFEHESSSFDGAIRSWVIANQSVTLFDAFLVITWLGSSVVLVPFAISCSVWLWHKGGHRVAAAVVAAPAAATGLFIAIKDSFRRVRPAGAIRLHQVSYAFPSGHATTASAVLATIAYVFWREGFVSGRCAIAIGAGGPLLIGISRVYLDVHWTTDVLGGWAAGAFVAVLCASLYEYLRRGTRAASALTSE